jgi:hypothetical protein
MPLSTRSLAIAASAVALAVGGGAAYAATGGSTTTTPSQSTTTTPSQSTSPQSGTPQQHHCDHSGSTA